MNPTDMKHRVRMTWRDGDWFVFVGYTSGVVEAWESLNNLLHPFRPRLTDKRKAFTKKP